MNNTEENTMLKLGENLKKFRSKRELTQEQLAAVLGVSAQAVSRWENGTTYPDITLLPTIASYFEITLDELMGMEAFKSEEQLKELTAQLDENGSKGLIYENIKLLRDAVKTYPANNSGLSISSDSAHTKTVRDYRKKNKSALIVRLPKSETAFWHIVRMV